MSSLAMALASGGAEMSWYHGIHVSERIELLVIASLFFGTLILVYFIQRWIGDY